MTRRIAAAVLILLSAISGAFVLDDSYTIVAPENPTVSEETGIRELGDYIERSTGLRLPVSKAVLPPGRKGIFLGWQPESRKRLWAIKPEVLAPEEIIVRSFEDDSIVLTGEGRRGTLYAVYTFLEEVLGIRWLAPDAEIVPKIKPGTSFPELYLRYAPQITVRNPGGAYFSPYSCREPAFCAKHKVNGTYKIPAEYGGSAYDPLVFMRSHSMEILLPWEASGKRPELYAERDGRRLTGGEGQPCLTNPDVKDIILANSISGIKSKSPLTNIFYITQNDNTNYCLCENCKRKAEELGGQTDLLVWFLNDIAEKLDKEFPGIQVETFAYNYTIEAPKTVKPAKNIRFCICIIEADSRLPLTREPNKYFADIIRNWGKVTSNLSIWHYITNFTNYGLIHPNLHSLGPNIRFFTENNISNIFSQDSADAGSFGFFAELRGYLNAKLMWNPSLNADEVIADFIKSFYGPAAVPMAEYLRLYQNALLTAKGHVLDCYEFGTNAWLPWEMLKDGTRLLDKAENLAKDRPEILARVANIRLSHDWTTLWRVENSPLRQLTGNQGSPDVDKLRKSVEEMLPKVNKSPGFKNLYTCEGGNINKGLENLDRFLGKPFLQTGAPKMLHHIPASRRVALESTYFQPAKAEVVEDYLSPCKKALRLYLGNHNWAARVTIPAVRNLKPGKVYAEVRLPQKVTNATGTAVITGLYTFGTNFMKKTVIPVDAAALTNQGYTLLPLGDIDFKRDYQIYFEGANNSTVPELLVSRIWIVKGE